MSDSQETSAPKNLVAFIRNHKLSSEIYLESVSSEKIIAVKKLALSLK